VLFRSLKTIGVQGIITTTHVRPLPSGAKMTAARDGDDDDPWDDWRPCEQTALDFIRAAEEAKRAVDGNGGDSDDDDDDSDDWNPMEQEAAGAAKEDGEEGDGDELSLDEDQLVEEEVALVRMAQS